MTRTRFFSSRGSSLALAAALVLVPATHARLVAAPQSQAQLRIDIAGATAGSVLAIALNGGKVADAPITQAGAGTSILDLTNLGKVQAEVYVKVCKDGHTEVLLYTDGGVPPKDNECESRKVGAFWWGKSHRIVINVRTFAFSAPGNGPLGLSGRAIGIGAAAIGGGVAIAAAGGSSSSTPSAPASSGTPSTPTTPSGGGTGTTPSFGFANGAWRNTLTLQQDACGGFASSANTTATVTVDTTTGNGTIVHVHPTATLNYTATTTRTSDTAGTVTGTGTVAFGSSTYRTSITLQINGTSVTVTENFDRTAGGSACNARYTGSGTHQ